MDRIKKITWNNLLDRRLEIFGLAAIWIVLFHLYTYVGYSNGNLLAKAIGQFISLGAAGVDIFLFFSGVGLFYSQSKNTTKQFYKNRILRLGIPYLSIAGIYYFWVNFISAENGFLDFIFDLSTVKWWFNSETMLWYMSFIIIVYLLFPVIFQLDRVTKSNSTLCIILIFIGLSFILSVVDYRGTLDLLNTGYEKILSRIPIFMSGIYIAGNTKKDAEIPFRKVVCITFVLGILYIIVEKYISVNGKIVGRWFKGLGALCLSYLYVWLTKLWILARGGTLIADAVEYMLCKIGKCSLEIYLVHICILDILNTYVSWIWLPWYIWWILIGTVTLCIAIAVSHIAEKGRQILLMNGNGKSFKTI